ncbi:MAG: immunoglobulin-like domain-containing protein [Coraliomargaritaceae bacterium]
MDTSAPAITINGDSTINLLIGEPYYLEQGATAVDNIDGNVAVNISGVVYTSSPQNSPFTITYTATDAAGNTSTATRIVNIIEPTWSKLGNDIDGEAEQDNSGVVSLSSDGTRVAIGARKNDGTDLDSGHVRVYEWTGDTWSQLGNDIDGEAKRDNSGGYVSLSGDGTRVAIGSPWNDGTDVDSGHVRVYEWSGDTWTQLGNDINGEAIWDESGVVSLSSDGSRVAIGARSNDGGGFNSGHVRVYEWDNSTWNQIGQDIDGEKADIYASNVSLSGDGTRVAIGAPGLLNVHTTGQVRIYDLINNTWIQTGQVIHGEADEDWSGQSVSLSRDGMRVAIGARGNDGEDGNNWIGGTHAVGHVRVYEWSNETWTQGEVIIYGKWTQIGQDIDGEARDDISGNVSLSSDGMRLAIGAPENDGGGNNSGHVRIYEWDNGTWNQLMLDIDGEAAEDSSGGWGNISLSGDGTRVAIGAPGNDGDDQSNALNEPGDDYGHVRVYQLPEEIKIKESDLFLAGGNTSWPNVIPLTRIVDGSSSQLEQKLIINVTELPVGGAYYRIIFIRSGTNGNWIPTPSEPLTLGLNVITVPPDTYNRAIRVQFNNGAVKFNTLAVQEVLANGYVLTGSVLFPGE